MTWQHDDTTPPRDAITGDCPLCHGTGAVETREPDSRVTTYEPCPRCGTRTPTGGGAAPAPQRRAYTCLTMPQVTRLWHEFAALDEATGGTNEDAATSLAEFFNRIYIMGQQCERERQAAR